MCQHMDVVSKSRSDADCGFDVNMYLLLQSNISYENKQIKILRTFLVREPEQ